MCMISLSYYVPTPRPLPPTLLLSTAVYTVSSAWQHTVPAQDPAVQPHLPGRVRLGRCRGRDPRPDPALGRPRADPSSSGSNRCTKAQGLTCAATSQAWPRACGRSPPCSAGSGSRSRPPAWWRCGSLTRRMARGLAAHARACGRNNSRQRGNRLKSRAFRYRPSTVTAHSFTISIRRHSRGLRRWGTLGNELVVEVQLTDQGVRSQWLESQPPVQQMASLSPADLRRRSR